MSELSESKSLDTDTLIAETTEDLESTWRKAPRTWGHSLHRLAPYVGRFPPSLVHYFIRRFSDVDDTVLDPFCGGGTTPLEAALTKRHGYGNDAFSYAYVLSRAKCNPIGDEKLTNYLDEMLDESKKVDNSEMRLLDNNDLHIFFSDYTLDKILRLREILSSDQSDKGNYLKAAMCGILHGPSKMYLSLQTKDTYSGTANYVKKYAERNGLTRPERDIRPKVLRKQELVQDDYIPSWLSSRTKITRSDARDLPYPQESVDLIVTSPPYMQTLDYTWNNWLRLWWLNEDRKEERDNIDITQDTSKYRTFMRECLRKMYDVLASDSVAVLIVGDVTKHLTNRKETLNVAGYLADEARENTEFDVHGIIDDSYGVDSRSYVVFNRLKYDYDDEDESKENIDRCLLLKKGSPDMSFIPKIDWEKDLYKDW